MIAVLAMNALTWAVDAILASFRLYSRATMTIVALLLGGVSVLANGLAMWVVLRRCADGLHLGRWLLAIVIGGALGAGVALPPWMLGVRLGFAELFTLSDDPAHLIANWLTVIVGAIVPLLPAGLLLQRLSGASALPFVSIAALAKIAAGLASPEVTHWAMQAGIWSALVRLGYLPMLAIVALVVALTGFLHGLAIGSGLYLMARQPVRPAAIG